jgi:hypothetical protein
MSRLWTILVSFGLLPPLSAGDAPDFNRDIRPILSENCFHCHGPDERTREGELRLDTYQGAIEGGEFGKPLVPGNPEKSGIIKRICHDDPDDIMPPPESKRILTDQQKQLLIDWIASGGEYQDHWAWTAPQRPTPPPAKAKHLVSSPVDSFLLHRLEQEGLSYSEQADPSTLLRRLSLDLIGLPPTLNELREFKVALRSPEGDLSFEALAKREERAISAAVSRLLASPRFGERWARPWLDLARYADSNGFQADQIRPSWAYRDWVIDALNANMPYDRFTIEQLAGDLLPDSTLQQKVATGFHRTVTCNVEAGVHPEENRVNQVVDRVNTTGTVWLGVTMECAQCHDHKYDPFSMKDYYSFFAFFNNTPLEVSEPKSVNDVSHDFIGPYMEMPVPPAQQKLAGELDKQIASATKQRKSLAKDSGSGFDAWQSGATTSVDKQPKGIAAILKKPSGKRNKKDLAKLQAHYAKTRPAIRKLDLELQRLRKQRAELTPDKTLVMVELDEPRTTRVMERGNYLSPADEVSPDTPGHLPAFSAQLPRNRLGLARWLVDRDNPLTARVHVNRLWAEIFGNGIVATLEDFGTQAEPPTHPDLLDWLAVEFIESGWDVKHILRTIVSSRAYRQSSKVTPDLLEKDPRNLLLARAPRFRLDAERVRDNALAVSGLLSEKMHGKPVMPYQPPGLWRQTGRNEPKWIEQKDENRWRRGIYIVYRRAAPYPSMVNFDAPDRGACTVKRPRTNTPLQALTLLNDPAYVEMALALADRVLTGAPDPATRIDHAFQLVLSRLPTNAEKKRLESLYQDRLARFTADPKAADTLLKNPACVYRPKHPSHPELAAWLYLANVLLNLDETMTKG